jgi:hypothetical protein
VWDNQDYSMAPENLRKKYEPLLGKVYIVTALMDCPGMDELFYYVGIAVDLPENMPGTPSSSGGNLVLDVNLRPATMEDLK